MHRRTLLALASSLALMTLGIAATRADEIRISGPVVHENLAIYLIHGKSAAGPVPLTLDEALAKRSVKVHETGNVNELQIENLGSDEVFVQSGDIVKGGQQDRVLSVSLLLPPSSGRIPIASFCVEQGRWTARGKEDAKTFATASAVVPSREAKIAMKAPITAEPPATPPGQRARPTVGLETGSRQQEVWAKVRKVQDGLSNNLGVSVNAPASQSSLQLALENEKLKDAQSGYLAALRGAGEQESDVVGYVFAVNGKLNSAEIYPSNALFRKMWPKLLQASVTEAIGQKNAGGEATPTIEGAAAFLDEARGGKASERGLPAAVKLETRDADKSLYFETRRADGAWVHRSYLAK
jgi:ARG and Rhodanese-Phosphatase-superfamily-associated Protein domain